MTETGLIVAQVAFLVLLYVFVWSVVRSSTRELRANPPPPPPVEPAPEQPPRARPRREMAMAAAPVQAVSTPPSVEAAPAPPPVEASQPTAEPLSPAPVGAPGGEDLTVSIAARDSGEEVRLDLAANLHPRLVVDSSPALEEGHEIPLQGGITIGRSSAADLSIGDQFVSHMHARILRRGPYHFVEDLGSTNGTFLNDRRVERDAQLKVHDTLRIGQTVLRYEE
jgi:hypothetical protein